jgi:hypothetical protein
VKRPPKRDAALRHAATPKLTGLANDKSSYSFTQPCRHNKTRVEQMPQGHPHHAKEICAMCGCSLRWVSRAGLLERQSPTLSRLLMCPELLDWERALVRDASRGRRLTEKQQAFIDRLAAECLEGPNK